MKLIKRDPLHEIERFFDDQDFFGFFPAMRRHLVPPVDIYNTDSHVVVEMHVPNLDPKKISISVEDGMLKIEGSTDEEKVDESKEYIRKEIRSGSFARMVALQGKIREKEIEAEYEKGILKITLPKEEVKQPKLIEIKIK